MEHVVDMVNHPSHYQSETGLEVIDVIEAFTFDLKGIEATDTGNFLKYMCRWKGKTVSKTLKRLAGILNISSNMSSFWKTKTKFITEERINHE